MTKLIFFVLALLAVIFEIVADVLFKEWSINNKNLILGLGIVLYAIGTVFWAYSLKHEIYQKDCLFLRYSIL
jgi:multidrug transporter EmrE-like cation transporter